MELQSIFEKVKSASTELALIDDDKKNVVLQAVADAILSNKEALLKANTEDLERMDKSDPLYDRLQLTEKRLEDIANDMRHVSTLASPLGHVTKHKVLENGLDMKRISVPFGVIGMIYEARPNVTFDVFSLCFKSGNACILKGSKDADSSNFAEVSLIHEILQKYDINTSVVELLPATHEATSEMLNAVGYIDLCIPRGGKKLITFVRDTAKVPVIETGAGVVNTYFDEFGDMKIGRLIVNNAKTRRVSVCNALDCLIIHKSRIKELPELCALLSISNVELYADDASYEALTGNYPHELLKHADVETYGKEFMDYKMAIKTVPSIDAALNHIRLYGSGHSECIITEDAKNATIFQNRVDAACVYVNAPTSFTDGGQFGLGAEIGISTQKLGPRGPMALEEITTYKWLIEGHGQIRK